MYKLTSNGSIIRLFDRLTIPIYEDNSDYKEYLEWVDDGNTVAPADIIPQTFQALSAWQVRKVLNEFVLRDQIEVAITTADQTTKDAWQFAKEFERDNALLNSMALSLGLTDEQLDQLFSIGVTL